MLKVKATKPKIKPPIEISDDNSYLPLLLVLLYLPYAHLVKIKK